MIDKHGSKRHDRLRDLDAIFEWFRHTLTTGLRRYIRLIQRLTDEMSEAFEQDVVTPLRDMKSRLNVIKSLPNNCEIPADVQQFVKLWHELP